MNRKGMIFAGALLALSPITVFAYVGPGAGLGLLGSLVAILVAGLLAIFGLILLPYRMIQSRFGKNQDGESASGSSDSLESSAGSSD